MKRTPYRSSVAILTSVLGALSCSTSAGSGDFAIVRVSLTPKGGHETVAFCDKLPILPGSRKEDHYVTPNGVGATLDATYQSADIFIDGVDDPSEAALAKRSVSADDLRAGYSETYDVVARGETISVDIESSCK